MNMSDATVCVADLGLFPSLAELLVPHFGRVLYYCPGAESQSPTSNMASVGEGIPGVEKISDWEDVVDKVDAWFFTDVTNGPRQVFLASLGKPVWGARHAEQLELDRKQTKRDLIGLGLDVGPYKVVRGMTALREYLKAHKNVWVKASRIRGSIESFPSETYKLSEQRLSKMEYELGRKKEKVEFIVEDAIEDAVEIAIDEYCIDGVFPKSAALGIESKAKGYVCHFVSRSRMPEALIKIDDALTPTLVEAKCRQMWAIEARMTSADRAYVLDPCCRPGSPPSELLQLMYTNLPEILWEGAHGNCIDPIPPDGETWGAELMIHSTFAEKDWQVVHYPPAIAKNVKLRNMAVIDGERCVVPQPIGSATIGSVCATGATMKEATDRVKEIGKQIKADCIDIDYGCLESVKDDIGKLADMGVRF